MGRGKTQKFLHLTQNAKSKPKEAKEKDVQRRGGWEVIEMAVSVDTDATFPPTLAFLKLKLFEVGYLAIFSGSLACFLYFF